MLDYAGCVLNNWERIDPAGPLVPSNVRLLRRFTGLVDEAGLGDSRVAKCWGCCDFCCASRRAETFPMI